MKIDWRGVVRHYLQVVAFCGVVALLTNAIWPRKSYLAQLGSALCVGSITWAVIEFGRYFVDPRHCHHDAQGGHGWPIGWRGFLLTGLGIGAGFFIGMPLGDWLLGDGVISSARDNRISLIITLAAGTGASFYFHARGKSTALAAQIAVAERDASEAKLKLLETQLEPHMLFNTLANLRVLIATDPPRAVAMLDRLNSYLRVTLSGSRALAHPLAAEFDRLADYLELMSVRMGERLRYTLDVPTALRQVPVPPLLLQPLVENAIRHGLEPKVEGGEVTVRARLEPGADGGAAWLRIEVMDTGVGLDGVAADGPSGGVGPIAYGVGAGAGSGRTDSDGDQSSGGRAASIAARSIGNFDAGTAPGPHGAARAQVMPRQTHRHAMEAAANAHAGQTAEDAHAATPDSSHLPRSGSGFGLAQVRERLATAYGTRGALTLARSTPEGGTLAVVTLPLPMEAAQ